MLRKGLRVCKPDHPQFLINKNDRNCRKAKLIQDTIGRMTDAEIIAGVHDWRVSARPEQLAPEGDWWTWLFLAGRGAGEHVRFRG